MYNAAFRFCLYAYFQPCEHVLGGRHDPLSFTEKFLSILAGPFGDDFSTPLTQPDNDRWDAEKKKDMKKSSTVVWWCHIFYDLWSIMIHQCNYDEETTTHNSYNYNYHYYTYNCNCNCKSKQTRNPDYNHTYNCNESYKSIYKCCKDDCSDRRKYDFTYARSLQLQVHRPLQRQ